MKKLITITLALVLVLTLGATVVFAGGDQIPSAKTAAVVDEIGVVAEDVWVPILTVGIKTGTPKDLVIDVSVESALFTTNKIKGAGVSTAEAAVMIRVKVDGDVVGPEVAFNQRLVELSGNLKHLDPLEPSHWIQIYMATKSANAFSWVAVDVGPNVSVVVVEALVTDDATYTGDPGGAAIADALIGWASVVVDDVMLK